MANQLIARFAVTGWEPRTLEGLGEDWIGAVTMRKSFTSGITGESVALFVSAGDVEGQRTYFALERITGSVEGAGPGSVTVQHGGAEADPAAWFGVIVPGSGTGGFAGWAGSARIEHDGDGAYFVIELSTEPSPGDSPAGSPGDSRGDSPGDSPAGSPGGS